MPVKMDLQSWTKVLGTVQQYSYFSVISWFPYKIVHTFRNFLAVPPPPTLYKAETQKKILDTHVQHCLWREGRGWTCVNWKMPQKCISLPRLLSMSVWKRGGGKKKVFRPLKVFFSGFWWKIVIEQLVSQCAAFQSFLNVFEEFTGNKLYTPEIVVVCALFDS